MNRAAALILIGVFLPNPAFAEADPLENFNRGMFGVNNTVIDYIITPSATFLEYWIPDIVQTAGRNIYSNLTEPEFVVTNLFIGDHQDAMVSVGRFAVNSTIGIGGLFDPATRFGLMRRETEFGESLCALGVPTTPYLVLPIAGPSNVWSATLLTGFVVGGWYLLSLVSTALATADLVLDLSASAASLRHASDQPEGRPDDPYQIQKTEYRGYLDKGCPSSLK